MLRASEQRLESVVLALVVRAPDGSGDVELFCSHERQPTGSGHAAKEAGLSAASGGLQAEGREPTGAKERSSSRRPTGGRWVGGCGSTREVGGHP